MTDRFQCVELRKALIIDLIEFAVHALSLSGLVEQHRRKPSPHHHQWEALDGPECSETASSAKARIVQWKSSLQCSEDKNERHDHLKAQASPLCSGCPDLVGS